jgi:hypothetical protein
LSYRPGETELILPRGSNFRVDGDEIDSGNQRHTYLTMLPAGDEA